MCRRNFFKFAIVCFAFQMLFGLPVMANESSDSGIESTKKIDSSDVNLTVSDEESKNSDDDQIDISVLLGDQPVKEVKLTVILDSKSAKNADGVVESTDSKSKSVSDGIFEGALKDAIQARKDKIISSIGLLKNLLNQSYSNPRGAKLLDFVKTCRLGMEIVGDNGQKTLQIDLESPTPVVDTVLLEKTSLDENNDRFVEINLINK